MFNFGLHLCKFLQIFTHPRDNPRTNAGPALDRLRCLRARPFDGLDHRLEDLQAVRAAEPFFAGAIRMRHQSEYVAFAIADAGDVLNRSVGVRRCLDAPISGRVAQNNLMPIVELAEGLFIGEIAALAVRDGQPQKRTLRSSMGEGRIGHFDARRHQFADEMQLPVPDERPRKQADFA
jgi:hypothetical protein